MVKNGYKETEIGIIPENWEIRALSEISSKIGDGLHGTPIYSTDGKYHFINGNNLVNGNIVSFNDTKKVDLNEYKKFKLNLGNSTILISINGTIGNLAYYNYENVILGKSSAYINLNEEINKEYIYYSLLSHQTIQYFNSSLTGTTIKNLSLETLRNTKIAFPSFYEQKKIADILSAVDKHIEEIDAQIKDLTTLKKAMMQRLLTQGIGHTEFKDTEVGRIPIEWEIKTLNEVCVLRSGYAFNAQEYSSIGNIIIRMSNISTKGRLQVNKENVKYCDESLYNSLTNFHLHKGDVIICMTDVTPEKNIIGRTAIIDENDMYIQNQRVGLLKIMDTQLCYNYYLNYYTNFETYLKTMRDNSGGSAQSNIGIAEILKVKIPLPSLSEQKKISSILSSFDNSIDQYQQQKEDYTTLKKGLMQKLLTGQIRITL
jgi:type I restriction enzyme, S subunit